ncbi:tyrosine-protein kinase family protein [Flagellimonas sp. S3867]|uniref:GumC family protein n=1 Tax=Flagellimonas sp. S3867 TaxID=2768063 RepID=UPI0016857790|nr:tyrosine-protein kinase family protein [Flagellimonas sp. S3867]
MSESKLDLKSLITDYVKHWRWFLFSVVITIGLAYLHLRYTVPQYDATAKIQIIEDKGASSELSVLQDLDIFSGGKAKVEDEVEILKARSNFIEIVRKLKLNVRYFVEGNVMDSELYGQESFPFIINFMAEDSIVNKSQHEFYIDLNSATSFLYTSQEDQIPKSYTFGSNIKTKIGNIILVPNVDQLDDFLNQRLKIVINPIPKVALNYRSRTRISSADKLMSNIINISLTDGVQRRAIEVINHLVEINNSNAVADKKAIADKTFRFINDRINEIYSSLSSVDETAETFKASRGIADLGSQSSVNFQQSAASEHELQNANIQLSIANSMKELINGQDDYDVIPEVGLADQGISGAAQRYNGLVAQRNRLLESSNVKNPVIVKLDQQLESLKRGMQSSLNNVSNNLNLQVNSLNKQLSQINSRIYAAPGNERALRDISRRQQTTESLYLYLLQKREESQITFASAAPKSKVVDYAYGSNLPVSPKPKIIYIAALLLGVITPFSIIYLNQLIDSKIHNKIDLEKIVGDIPVLAEIPKIGRKEEKLVKGEDRSVLAESLRILRTNVDYIFQSKKKNNGGKVIFVTSSVPGEGKTFLSSNLSLIFANTGKKVLLIGADIRNPKIYTFFPNDKNAGATSISKRSAKVGLTEYLSNSNFQFMDIANKLNVDSGTIDVVYSGKIPPNPAELLMNNRVQELFSTVSELYDYVIVDTAPLMVVTDTLLISKHADQILYVTKAGVTEKKVLDFPAKLYEEGKLKGLSFVVNNVKASNLGYGGKYGYGYGKTVKKWWNFS